ncbi:tetratricopeptide repeat protein [bacterium]|nr:tetratricopeptide repeat protein [bacterium]
MEENKSNIRDLIEMGELYLEDNSLDEALKEFRKAYDIDSKNIDVLNSLAYSYYLKNDYDQSLKYYNTLLELGEDDSQLHFDVGLLYYLMDNLDIAEKEFTNSIDRDKDFPDPYYYLANLHLLNRRKNETISNYYEFLKREPGSEFKEQILKDIFGFLQLEEVKEKGSISFSISAHEKGNEANILYRTIFPTAVKMKLHSGFNDWQDIHDRKMINISDDLWIIIIRIPEGTNTVEFTFLNEKGECDNNKGANWIISL